MTLKPLFISSNYTSKEGDTYLKSEHITIMTGSSTKALIKTIFISFLSEY